MMLLRLLLFLSSYCRTWVAMTFTRCFFVGLILSLISSVTVAQQLNHPVMVSRDDAFSAPRPFRVMADTIDVLAVMVQFQIDADARTTGNGQFDLTAPAATGLDAPPHNRQYFLDHLTFLTLYYRKASKNKTIIRTTIIDTVYTLGGIMQSYSPPKTGPNTLVGNLARDTWQKVDSSGKVPDFSRYDAFVVFHAGVGRDIDVVGIVGFDPTPLDIPSLYLGLNAFKQFYGATYEGIPVRGGFRIANTIVMPETETRELPATPTNFLLRLGINGLLCASVGNYLGLPDLFDTNTGRSGIGRFGLMDGQAIFSFAGLFPPEPSAWEKYWLGWIQPITVRPDTNVVSLPAVSIADSIYRVPISASEYFLVENRSRDAGRNGQRVTSSYGGVLRQQTFQRDTAGFNAFDLATITGNVLDVEDFDWSLPGGVGTNNVFYDGGILIWHIDETVIAQGLTANGVNGNPLRRGVDVEEADGSQDIGESYGQLEAGSGSEEGTALDFWYQGNESPVNKNIFSATSYPSSASNSGGNSHITIKEFSVRGPRMTAKVIVGDAIALLPNFPKSLPNKTETVSLTVANLGGTIGQSLFVTTGTVPSTKPQRGTTSDVSKIFAWKMDGNGVLKADGTFAAVETPGSTFLNSVAVKDLDNDGIAEIVTGEILQGIVPSNLIRAYSARPQATDSMAAPFLTRIVSRLVSTSPVVTDSIIGVGGAGGKVYFLKRDGSIFDSTRSVGQGTVRGITSSGAAGFIAVNNDGIVASVIPGVMIIIDPPGPSQKEFGRSIVGPVAIGQFTNERSISFATSDGFLYLLRENLETVQGFPINTGSAIAQSPALADIDGDGNRDIIVFAGNKIHAYNYAGASLDNFPKQIPSSKPITSNPVVADVDGDGDVDIVAVTSDGLVVAYDKNGAMANGFPLQAGTGNQSVAAFAFPATALSVTNIGLAVASSEDGSVTAWKTGSVGGNGTPNLPWPQYQHDAQHTGLATEPLTGKPISSAFFPKDRAYNWPNPVYDGKTFIRYFIQDNATVKIKIFDLAGDLVTEFAGPGVGGVDNEVQWNVAGVQSGVYLARIEANGAGKTETAIVKVAVVK